MTQSGLLQVIDQIHQAALQPELWPRALQSMADSVGALGTSVVPLELTTVIPLFNSAHIADRAHLYTPEMHARNTRVSRALARGLKRGLLDVDNQLFTPDEWRRDAFNEECMVPVFETRSDVAFLVTPLRSDRVVTISALRGVRQGAYDDDQKSLWDVLGRHAARSLTITALLATGYQARGASVDLLSALDCGAAFLAGDGTVLHFNAAAEAMAGNGFSTASGKLRASRPTDQLALDALLSAATAPETATRLVGPIRLARQSGRPLLVHAIGVGPSTAEALNWILLGGRSALVFIIDPDIPAPPVTESALRSLGLTRGESRLALRVGAGTSVDDAAVELGITGSTARTVLKRAFAKLGINRQAELVALVSRLRPPTS